MFFFCLLIFSLIDVLRSSSSAIEGNDLVNAPFHWSASPSTLDSLNTTGTWQALKGTVVHFRLPKEPSGKEWRIFIQYTVQAFTDSSLNTTSGVRFLQPRGTEASKEYLAARVTLDGQAFRLGGSLGVAESGKNYLEIRGALVLDVAEGQHSVSIQWKKWGKVSLQASNRWVSSYRWISAFAEASFIDAVQPLSDAKLVSKNWTTVPGMSLDFEHPFRRNSPRRFSVIESRRPVVAFYRLQVRADSSDVRTISSVSARVLLDGAPLEDGASLFAFVSNSKSLSPNSLGHVSGTVRLPESVLEGKHALSVQWQMIGDGNSTWSSSPTFLDGWIESRILAIASE